MGIDLSKQQQKHLAELQVLVEKAGQSVSFESLSQLLKEIEKQCPFYPENGSLRLRDWEKIGRTFHVQPRTPVEVLQTWHLCRFAIEIAEPVSALASLTCSKEAPLGCSQEIQLTLPKPASAIALLLALPAPPLPLPEILPLPEVIKPLEELRSLSSDFLEVTSQCPLKEHAKVNNSSLNEIKEMLPACSVQIVSQEEQSNNVVEETKLSLTFLSMAVSVKQTAFSLTCLFEEQVCVNQWLLSKDKLQALTTLVEATGHIEKIADPWESGKWKMLQELGAVNVCSQPKILLMPFKRFEPKTFPWWSNG